MCGGPEQTHAHASYLERESRKEKMGTASNAKKKYDYEGILNSSSSLLELAANDDLNGFIKCVEEQNAKVDELGWWYVRHSGTGQMVLDQRTPAMVAALYGNMNVLTYIVSHYAMYGGDIDQVCGSDGSTAIHCAAAGGSMRAIQVVQLLLKAGASTNVCDAAGRRPADVLAVYLNKADVKSTLEDLLNRGEQRCVCVENGASMPISFEHMGLSASMKNCSTSSALSTASGVSSLSMSLSASASPKSPHMGLARGLLEDRENAREFSLDALLPDIKNAFYSSDEFRMYSFKIRPCSRAYSHDWTECPFAHPGENARRRDPRKHHYSCVPCPDYRLGVCSHGDACEYAHGVFECWLHPAQYRTRLCKDGVECKRKVCFFAHVQEELRPVYASTGSGLPSPMSAGFTDMSSMSPPPLPHNPRSPSLMSPYSPLHPLQSTVQGSIRTSPMAPTSSAWPQATVPALHLPGANLHSSRLRSAFTARDASTKCGLDEQFINDFQALSACQVSAQAHLNVAAATSGNGSASLRSGSYKNLGLTVAPANLEALFASESSVPSPGLCVREANLPTEFEHVLTPQKHLHVHSAQGPILQSPRESPFLTLGFKGPQRQGVSKEAAPSTLVVARAASSQSSQSSRELAAGKDLWWADWGSPTGKLEWGVREADLSNLRKSASFRRGDSAKPELEPDLSWVQKLVMEGSIENDEARVASNAYYESGRDHYESGRDHIRKEGGVDKMVSSWIDNLCVDKIAA